MQVDVGAWLRLQRAGMMSTIRVSLMLCVHATGRLPDWLARTRKDHRS